MISAYFDPIINYLVFLVEKVGYLGIFIGMFLESTLVPIPSEIIMIPAGIAAAHSNGMNLYIVIAVGIIGNVGGAIFSYYLASYLGRAVIFKIGKYFFIKPATIIKVEDYFKNHGAISVFIGRLIPGVRHFISLPAGLAKMDLKKFYFYTTTGSGIWVTILSYLGFLIGENKELIKEYISEAIIYCLIICFIIAIVYCINHNRNKKLKP